jgi:hypothetical protein
MFGPGTLYGSLQWFWLIGAAVPFIIWLVAKKFPKSGFRYLHAPLIFGGLAQMPP